MTDSQPTGPSTERTSVNADTDAEQPTHTVPIPPTAPDAAPDNTAPDNTAPAEAAENAHPAAPAAAAPQRMPKSRPLFPTILWGAMMLALAAFFAAGELVPGGLDLVTWLLTAVVGVGLLLVVAGIAAASRRAG